MQLTGLEGRIALVTGGSRGIGKAIAEVLAKSGVQLVCCARNQEVLVQTCSEIEKDGGVALPVKADVSLASDRKQLIEQTLSSFGGIDFLINNAGIHVEKEALELSDKEFIDLIEINLFSMFFLSRDIARHMVTRGGGRIINMGSFWGQLGISKQLAYCVSKAAIEALTRSLAVEWAPYNIQVNTVAPGYIRTDLSKVAMEDEQLRTKIQRRIPAKRFGNPEDVAPLVAFLCSQEADYLTGHIYYVDGGVLISR